jgi:large subunit ribosomal protein L5e
MSSKLIKNSSYFSRFQTPYRRRREGKTDYAQRSALIRQDKTKYGAAKYRLVARLTNTKVIAQVVTSTPDHDVTLAQATSAELPRYGVKIGLSNYAAAYCTGLLLARRLLKKLNLDETFTKEVTEEDEEERRPFRVLLDIGLRRSTTGARVFGVMKGAIDGGLAVPHKTTRIAGSADAKKDKHHKEVDRNAKNLDKKAAKKDTKKEEKKEDKKGKSSAPKRDMNYFIYGQHVADYMRKLKAENEEAYKRQFSRAVKEGITADNLQAMYKKAHEAIRKDPTPAPKATEHYKLKVPQTKKLTLEEKRANLNKKLEANGLPPHRVNLEARVRVEKK